MLNDDFNFEIVNFPLFDGDVPRSPSYGVCVLLECVIMLMTSTTKNLFLTAKLLKQGFRYHKFEKHFLNSTTDNQS